MIKWVAILLGWHWHEFQWEEPDWENVEGKQRYVQRGYCRACHAAAIRLVEVD